MRDHQFGAQQLAPLYVAEGPDCHGQPRVLLLLRDARGGREEVVPLGPLLDRDAHIRHEVREQPEGHSELEALGYIPLLLNGECRAGPVAVGIIGIIQLADFDHSFEAEAAVAPPAGRKVDQQHHR